MSELDAKASVCDVPPVTTSFLLTWLVCFIR